MSLLIINGKKLNSENDLANPVKQVFKFRYKFRCALHFVEIQSIFH